MEQLKEHSQKIIEKRTEEINNIMTNELHILYLIREKENLKKKFKKIMQDNEIFESEWQAAKAKNSTLEKLLEDKEATINNLKENLESLKNDHINREKIENLEVKLKEEVRTSQLRQATIEMNETKIQWLESNLVKSQLECADFSRLLEKEIKSHDQSKHNLLREKLDLKNKLDRSELKTKELENKLENANLDKAILNGEYQKSTFELQNLVNANENLKKDFSMKNQELESRNLK